MNTNKDLINNVVKTKFSEAEFICLQKLSDLLVYPPDAVIRFAVKEYVLKNFHRFSELDQQCICDKYDFEYIRRNRKFSDSQIEEVQRLKTTGV